MDHREECHGFVPLLLFLLPVLQDTTEPLEECSTIPTSTSSLSVFSATSKHSIGFSSNAFFLRSKSFTKSHSSCYRELIMDISVILAPLQPLIRNSSVVNHSPLIHHIGVMCIINPADAQCLPMSVLSRASPQTVVSHPPLSTTFPRCSIFRKSRPYCFTSQKQGILGFCQSLVWV